MGKDCFTVEGLPAERFDALSFGRNSAGSLRMRTRRTSKGIPLADSLSINLEFKERLTMTDSDQNDAQELLELRKIRSLMAYLSSNTDLINAGDACTLISPAVSCDAKGVISAASAAAALENLRSTRPYLFHSSRASFGIPSSGVQPRIKSDEDNCREIFGPKSNSGRANTLARSNISEYRRLRLKAVSLGLVGA